MLVSPLSSYYNTGGLGAINIVAPISRIDSRASNVALEDLIERPGLSILDKAAVMVKIMSERELPLGDQINRMIFG